MLSRVSERTMHCVRWVLLIGWLVLIASFFYDPISSAITESTAVGSPFRLNPEVYLDPSKCVKIRDACLPEQPFAMGAIVWWAMIVPAGIFILLTFGHEFWRRICPLSFISQLPRALGIQRTRKVMDASGQVRREVVRIREDSWLGRNHLYFQSALFFLGLCARILFVNSDRFALGTFLVGTLLAAILVGYLYAGKSWCNYFCPMAPVQMVYTGPRSLLGSQAHQFRPSTGITQSMCRTVTNGQEHSACVACKMPCIDIDAEKTYWAELNKPGRRLVQYGYLGMVIAFYLYYFLYAGNWDYYFSGAWAHEEDQIDKIFDIGFYVFDRPIPIPKIVAVSITFAVIAGATFALGLIIEKLYRSFQARRQPITAEQAQHRVFTLFTIVSFWTFFCYGARPSINRLPDFPVLAFNALVVLVGAMWVYRTFGRSRIQYERESVAASLRKRLVDLPIQALLDGRSLDDLTPDEVYTLSKAFPSYSQQIRLETYTGILRDLLEQGITDVSGSYDFLRRLRQDMGVDDPTHFSAVETIGQSQPDLLTTRSAPAAVNRNFTRTLATHSQADLTIASWVRRRR